MNNTVHIDKDGLETPQGAVSAPTIDILDKQSLARILRVSKRTIDNLIAEGMPHLKLGARCVRFDLEEVKVWLKRKYWVSRRVPNKRSTEHSECYTQGGDV